MRWFFVATALAGASFALGAAIAASPNGLGEGGQINPQNFAGGIAAPAGVGSFASLTDDTGANALTDDTGANTLIAR